MNQDILYKYFRGQATPDEERQILDWVDASPDNRKQMDNERWLFDVALLTDTDVKQQKRRTSLRPVLMWSARIAAAFIVALCGYFVLADYHYLKDTARQTVTVPAGQRAHITLADGTRVWLNSKSTLSYGADFGRGERNVELDGEAYFEVAKNKKVPFFVNTEMNRVKVVGTAFNLCAYRGSRELEIAIVEGIVDICLPCEDRAITRLQPDEYFINKEGVCKKSVFASHESLRWKEGLYCFDNVTFKNIVNKVEKYYDVAISVKCRDLMEQSGFTGKFREQDGVEHILRTLSKEHPFRYQFNTERDSIIIYDK